MATTTEERKIKIILDGKQVNASLKEMEAAQKLMNNQLRKMSTDDPARAKLLKDFTEMRQRIKSTKDELYGVQKAQAATQTGFGGITKATGMMGGAFKSAMAALLPLFAVQKVFAFLDDSKSKFESQANAVAQLEASLNSTGHAAGFTSKELQDMASQLQGKTLFGDEATIQAQSLLLTFTNIKKGVFEDAIPAIQDMATKMAGDGPANLKGASIQLGKALNDPIKGVSALAEVGVSFTEEQKATIKTMVEMNDTAGAQKLILAELNKEFGGSAEAARKAGSGGYKAFMNTVGDIQELLGEKLSNGLNYLGNFFGLVIEKSDPLVAVFRELWSIGGELYDEVYNIVSSLEIFNSEGDGASTVVNVLTGAFTLLLYPIKVSVQVLSALVTGFINLYNRSEILRGMIGGLGGAFMQLVTFLRDNVMKTIGGVGDLLVGIFTLDSDKIKAGLKNAFSGMAEVATGSGKAMFDGFAKGYADNKNDQIIRKVKQGAEEVQKATLAVAAETGEKQKQLTEQQLKEREKQEKKHQEELKKAREKYNDAYVKSELELAKLKIEVMDAGVDKVLAKLRLQHEQELAELATQRQAVLENVAATEEEKQALLNQYNEQQKLKEEEYKIAQQEAEKEDREAKYEKFLEDLEEEEAVKQEAIQQQFMNAMDADFEREQALSALKKATLSERLAALQEAGKRETQEAAKIQTEIMKLDKEMAEGKVKNAEKTAKAKKELEMMTLTSAIETFKTGIDLLGKETIARKAAIGAFKAFSLGKIAIDLQEEISAIWKTANQNPLNALLPGSGAVIAGVKTAAAIVRANGARKEIIAQEFAVGGNTVPMVEVNGTWQMASGQSGGGIGAFASGGDVKSARLGLIGEAGAEWVMPNWMIRSPKYANTYQWLESERVKGARAFAEGGATAGMPAVPAVQDKSAELLNALQQINNNLVANSQRIEQWQQELHVNYNAGAAEEVMALRGEMQRKGGF